MNHFITSRLAARAGTRTATLLVRADNGGDQIAAMIRAAERDVLAKMKPGANAYAQNYYTAIAILRPLPDKIWASLRSHLAALRYWAHDQAARAIIRTLPKAYLRAAAARFAGLPRATRVREHEHGPIEFSIQFNPNPEFVARPVVLEPSDEQDYWRDLLFPPPSKDQTQAFLDRIMPSRFTQANLFDLLGDEAGKITPIGLSHTIAQAYARGDSTASVSRLIRPYFNGSAMRAERSARTLGAYVGSERNFATSEALGDMVTGYQVHNPGGENARHEHAMRSGTIYYRNPKPGQVGMDVMPHPPQDTQRGPHDDMKAPHGLCYNCRCWITPVLSPLPAMDLPVFQDNAAKLIPDISHFADWFAVASRDERRKVAGPRRLATAANLLGRDPTWSDIVDPDTGLLLRVEELTAESQSERDERRAKTQAIISHNRALTRRVAAFGAF